MLTSAPSGGRCVTDVFSALIGQERAAAVMRHHVAQPVHAYLFVGPSGAGIHEGVLAFAASLLCEAGGCGDCDTCRRVLAEGDSEVTFLERSGLNWSVKEFAEAERISRRKPLGKYQIVVIEDVNLSDGQTGKLLKILEEPPSRAIFMLTANSLPESLATIESRCVTLAFQSLSEEAIVTYLTREGSSSIAARAAAAASGGDLRRAHVLVRDVAFADRVQLWKSLPDRLTGTNAVSSVLTAEILAGLDAAATPLAGLHAEEMAALTANAKAVGLRALPGRRDIEARHKRELRRFRIEDIRFGLKSLAETYRHRLLSGLEGMNDGDVRSRTQAAAALEAIDLINEASQRLSVVGEEALLTNLLVSLSSI
jgi:DNA polymerase-3 subunit delta'